MLYMTYVARFCCISPVIAAKVGLMSMFYSHDYTIHVVLSVMTFVPGFVPIAHTRCPADGGMGQRGRGKMAVLWYSRRYTTNGSNPFQQGGDCILHYVC